MIAIKTFAPGLALVLVAAATSAQDRAGAKPPAAADAAIVASERALHEATVKGDRAAFQSLVAADGVWTTSHGFVPFNLLAGDLESFSGITKWDIVNPHVMWLDDGAAILFYARTGAGTFYGEPMSPLALATTVWVRRGGKWVAAQHQETDQAR